MYKIDFWWKATMVDKPFLKRSTHFSKRPDKGVFMNVGHPFQGNR
jgi:hypothetical protein